MLDLWMTETVFTGFRSQLCHVLPFCFQSLYPLFFRKISSVIIYVTHNSLCYAVRYTSKRNIVICIYNFDSNFSVHTCHVLPHLSRPSHFMPVCWRKTSLNHSICDIFFLNCILKRMKHLTTLICYSILRNMQIILF